MCTNLSNDYSGFSPKYRSLSVTETAALMRAQLKAQFPGTKFSVRSKSYSGGASIDVSYTGGPSLDLVEPVVHSYQGADFDGSIDLKYSVLRWLYPDGTMSLAHDAGTVGSHGYHSEQFGDPIKSGAELVRPAADFCSVRRTCTPEEYWAVVKTVEEFSRWDIRHQSYQPWTPRGEQPKPRELQQLWAIESAANRMVDKLEAFRLVANAGAGEVYKENAPAMDPLEIEARIKYGILETPGSSFDREVDAMIALLV